jgi:hypothetical protein
VAVAPPVKVAGPFFDTDTSAGALTVVVAVAELFPATGSVSVVVALAVFVIMVPFGVPTLTRTTSEKLAEALEANDGLVHETVPVPPAGGVLQVNAGPAV